MAFGLGRLALCPRDFWRTTPRELAAAMEAVLGPARAPLDRAGLAALMARFPDTRRVTAPAPPTSPMENDDGRHR
ncbi:phage tail assembly chaperone [Ancylobacter pratisalsi]|uniref:Phage tail assembly chaperone n=2 Tax=Ancylobacter pratisalsi TaxID=1745854 RepID=A0A6P1YNW3_9HYPH|nr:phage tail assembly chaperone [Ancylobacter pratisalsi]